MIEFRRDEFDSRVLGLRVFKAWVRNDAISAESFTALYDSNDVDVIFCFAPCHFNVSSVLQGLGFTLISIRSTYEAEFAALVVPAITAPATVTLRRLSDGTPSLQNRDLEELALVVGATSRYFKDGDIPHQKAVEVYREWLANSLYRGYASEGILAFDGQSLIGLNTLRFTADAAVIDLIGVTAAAQGTGIGRTLLHEGFAVCRERGVTHIRVATEAENVAACRFYQRNGFVARSTELVWHLHMHKQRGRKSKTASASNRARDLEMQAK
jgi:ribosomal protein S18 acetylase RimI-like enzyme